MLKITKDVEKSNRTRVRLYGRFTSEYIAEVEKVLSKNGGKESKVILDLRNVTFVDRRAMEFLSWIQSSVVRIENTPSYVMRWIELEAQSSRSS